MEIASSSSEMERPVNEEEREYLTRMLGSLGLYDASQDTFSTTEHPEDEKWIVPSAN